MAHINELAALVREPCQGRVDLAHVVSQVAARVRAKSEYYQRIEIFWLLDAPLPAPRSSLPAPRSPLPAPRSPIP
ncbi:hypothetical protein [Candidatus Viridilinea mediisalina]|uniref:hypothetical protein n=1 Tax=Candidatus Viridilinea mediisalina TaxID=2024553 RepID=UPI000F5AFBBA|nr:hypothetical protein [Candidatus Viridilinea mediisalina]